MRIIQEFPSIITLSKLFILAFYTLSPSCEGSTLLGACKQDISLPHSLNDGKPRIHEIASSRLIIAPQVQKRPDCEKIISTFQAAAEALPQKVEFFRLVLTNPKFSIICTTSRRIRKLIPDHGNPSAVFEPESGKMYLTPKKLTTGLLFHEMTHASNFFRHQKKCSSKSIVSSVFPLYPANWENMMKFTSALDIGDKRVERFKSLWYRKKNGDQLTHQEEKQLIVFNNAFQNGTTNCLRPLIRDINPYHTYNYLLELGYTRGQKGFTIKRGHDSMEIISAKQTKGKTIIYMKPVGEIFSFFESISMAHKKIEGSYRMKSPMIKVIEREAFTFQYLSKHLIKAFYPEAEYLLQKDIQHCIGRSHQSTQSSKNHAGHCKTARRAKKTGGSVAAQKFRSNDGSSQSTTFHT